jgi:hypothetical protein
MREIPQPGIYRDFPEADYFADPCSAPSLTQSIAKILIERSPLHAWYAHPKLNPDFQYDDDTKFDVGNVAHKLLIGRGKDIVTLDFDDWRTNAAKKAREAAAAEGKVAVLAKKVRIAEALVRAARDGCDAAGCSDAFEPGKGSGEVVIAWKEPTGFWCRSMIDWLSTDQLTIYDLKTTAMSVAPHAVGRMMVAVGWDIQAAMIERGLNALDPNGAGRRKFRFVAQEDDLPHAVIVCELSEAVMTMGRKKLAMAMAIWDFCFANDRWPGYATEIVRPEYPGWAESQWLAREIAEGGWDEHPKFQEVQAGIRKSREMLTDLSGG